MEMTSQSSKKVSDAVKGAKETASPKEKSKASKLDEDNKLARTKAEAKADKGEGKADKLKGKAMETKISESDEDEDSSRDEMSSETSTSGAKFVPWEVDNRLGRHRRQLPVPMLVEHGRIELIKYYMRTTALGITYVPSLFESFQLILAVIWSALFVVELYYPSQSTRWIFITIDTVFSCLFIIFFIVRFIFADSRIAFFYSFYTIIDVLTIAPALARWSAGASNSNALSFFRVVYTFRLIRVIDAMRKFRISGLVLPILRILLFFIVGVFIAAVLIVLVEPQTIPDFHTSLYFTVVTIATVGYGDLSLKSIGGRFLMSLIIIMSFIGVPVMAIQISKVISVQPKAMDRKYKRKRESSHVIVTGSIKIETLEGFLANLLHKVIILGPEEPSEEFKRRILFRFNENVVFLRGSCLNAQDLKRAKIPKANGVFIFADIFSSDPNNEDYETTFRVLSVRSISKFVPIYVQLLRPQSVVLSKLEVNDLGSNIIPLNVSDFKFKMIARATTVPGFPTLIGNLLKESSYEDMKARFDLKASEDLSLYFLGQSHELYVIDLPAVLKDVEYEAAAKAFYEEFNVLLVAVQTYNEIKVGPMGYVIQEFDKGHVIAPNMDVALKLGHLKYQNYFKTTQRSSAQLVPSHLTLDDARSLKGHIILVSEDKNYVSVVRGLRESNQRKPIVILTDAKLSSALAHDLKELHEVYHVKGSPLDREAFLRAGADRASFIVLLAAHSTKTVLKSSIEKAQQLVDRDTILSYKLISRYFHIPTPIVEVRREENFRYLTGPFDLPRPDESGTATSSSGSIEDSYYALSRQLSPAYAAGMAYSPNLIDPLMAQAYYNPTVLNVIDELLVFTRNPQSANVWLIDCPAECRGKPFMHLLKHLISRGLLPVGLYRPSAMAVSLAEKMSHERGEDLEEGTELSAFARIASERIVISCPPSETLVAMKGKSRSYNGRGHSADGESSSTESSFADFEDKIYVIASETAVKPFL